MMRWNPQVSKAKRLLTIVLPLAMLATPSAFAQEVTRGTTTGQSTARGYDHPNQFLHMQATSIADNMELVIQHSDQDRAASQKLAALEERFGKKPNILLFLIDGGLHPRL